MAKQITGFLLQDGFEAASGNVGRWGAQEILVSGFIFWEMNEQNLLTFFFLMKPWSVS